MPREDRRLTPAEKSDEALLSEHKFWLESLTQMGMAEPVMFQNVAPGQGAILWLTAGLNDPETRERALRNISRGVLQLADQARAQIAPALPVEESEEDMRMVTVQGPPLVQKQRGSIPPGKAAKNEPMARVPGGELVPAGKS